MDILMIVLAGLGTFALAVALLALINRLAARAAERRIAALQRLVDARVDAVFAQALERLDEGEVD